MKVFLSKNFITNSPKYILFRLHRDYSAIYYINGIDVTKHIGGNYDFAHFLSIKEKKDIYYVKDKLNKKVVVNYFVDKHLSTKQGISEVIIPVEEKKILEKCDLIIVSCQVDKMILVANGITTHIEVVTPPVKEEKFTTISDLEKNSFFKYGGLVKNDQIGLALVNYKNVKDIEDLIYIAGELKQYKFFVFGPKLKKLGSWKIKGLIKKAPTNLKFKSYVDEDIFKSAMLLSSFFIVTRELEGELITILEAMVTKTPIFTFHSHFTGDVLNDNVNCIHALNKEEMAKKIINSLNSCEKIVDEAYRFAMSNNYETCGKILKQLLTKYVDLDLSQE